jgi:hypothetical protein
MIRNPKTLALALVAVLAMSVVVASAASASSYTGSAYPTTGTGSNTAGKETFTTPGGTVQCDSHFEGTLASASSELTVTPKYSSCVAFGFLNATVNMNGCDYLFRAGASLGGGVYNNRVDICQTRLLEGGIWGEIGPITITAGTCKVDIPHQTGLSNVKTTNSGSSVTVEPNVTNITMNVTTDGFGCPFPGTGHFTGSYHGDVVLSRVGGGSISVSGA